VSRGFRNADETQAASERAVADAIGKILETPPPVRGTACGLREPISPERLEVLPTRALRPRQAAWEQANRL
jgi:hypothetical protein